MGDEDEFIWGDNEFAVHDRLSAKYRDVDLRDWSDDRTLLLGTPLDRARWLLCSEGWLADAAELDEYVRQEVES